MFLVQSGDSKNFQTKTQPKIYLNVRTNIKFMSLLIFVGLRTIFNFKLILVRIDRMSTIFFHMWILCSNFNRLLHIKFTSQYVMFMFVVMHMEKYEFIVIGKITGQTELSNLRWQRAYKNKNTICQLPWSARKAFFVSKLGVSIYCDWYSTSYHGPNTGRERLEGGSGHVYHCKEHSLRKGSNISLCVYNDIFM